jgi:NTP pyrophosphatase (non-canonical NTP hydrolase)
MTFREYQEKASQTAIYPNIGENFIYPALGLVGEAGEIANKVKKVIRDHNYELNEDIAKDLGKEVGDVLWYIAALCSELGIEMNKVAEENIDKLFSRKDRGQLKGSGDNR